jgi:hypothetical protein
MAIVLSILSGLYIRSTFVLTTTEILDFELINFGVPTIAGPNFDTGGV